LKIPKLPGSYEHRQLLGTVCADQWSSYTSPILVHLCMWFSTPISLGYRKDTTLL